MEKEKSEMDEAIEELWNAKLKVIRPIADEAVDLADEVLSEAGLGDDKFWEGRAAVLGPLAAAILNAVLNPNCLINMDEDVLRAGEKCNEILRQRAAGLVVPVAAPVRRGPGGIIYPDPTQRDRNGR